MWLKVEVVIRARKAMFQIGQAGSIGALALGLAITSGACRRDEDSARSTYYERKIGVVLQQSCAQSPTKSGCHVAADDRGNALGNLNVTSYESLTKRKDLLLRYGPYGLPALLLKVAKPYPIAITTWQSAKPTLITTDIAHVGGQLLDLTSPSFTLLDTWISNGFAVNNAPLADPVLEQTPCSNVLGTDPEFEPNADSTAPDFKTFTATVNPVIGKRCAAGNCHGSAANSLYLTCGTTPEATRWNYFAIRDYVSVDTGTSEILRRALSPSVGGVYHEGGTVFGSTNDADYKSLVAWATEKGGPTDRAVPGKDDGLLFFANRVQPMLVKRGCMMLNCHSGTMFHDYRLRGGSGGHFGLPATRKNYAFTLEQLALESDDLNASRLVRKNLPPVAEYGGLLHRGGPLFTEQHECTEKELAAAADSSAELDDQAPYCVIKAWFQKERAARFPTPPTLTGLVFVRRPPAPLPDTPQSFETYAPGAEVMQIAASLDATGHVTVGDEASLSAVCNLPVASTDARRPAVSWDAAKIAFSARSSAKTAFRVYVLENGKCAVEPTIDAQPSPDDGAFTDNGELVHNFDPAFAPDGSIVFASTRGNTKNAGAFAYHGPQRTPADPSRLNANLYVLQRGAVRQLTFLLNQELSPAFMRDGRLIFVTEKRAPGFYQLAGRRMNLDGGDYHPLFGQRDTIGFDQLTDVVELADKNFAAILSDQGAAHGAGTLAIINRSVGVDQLSTTAADYAQNPAAISWPNPSFFQHSLRLLDPAATGKLAGTQGAYRSPSPLPTQNLLASYAANVVSLAEFQGNFDIVEVDTNTGARTPLVSGPNDELWPVALAPRYNLRQFASRLDEPNGATQVFDDAEHAQRAQITILDAPLLSSLVFQNTRTGRTVPPNAGFSLSFWEDLPPETGVIGFASASAGSVFTDDYGKVYVRRALLGSPTLYDDGSASVTIRGGMPLVLQTRVQLAADAAVTDHFQREEMQFYPGEIVRQGFPRPLFNGLCAGCHGSLSGYEADISPNPDILTQASRVAAHDFPPTDLTGKPSASVGPTAP